MVNCIGTLPEERPCSGHLHSETSPGVALRWPVVLGLCLGSGPGVARCIGFMFRDRPWDAHHSVWHNGVEYDNTPGSLIS